MKMDFTEWMKQVDAILANSLCGLTSEDLPDCNYLDMYEDGYSPKRAASKALKSAREF